MLAEQSAEGEEEFGDERPRTPSAEDCCGAGCDPCIFDVHRSLLENYEKRERLAGRHAACIPSAVNMLHPSAYRRFAVTSIRHVSTDYLLLSLADAAGAGAGAGAEPPNESSPVLLIHPGQYVILRAWNLARPFTPISWTDRKIDFLVKIYPDGKFSTRLAGSKVTDNIDIRGPYGEFRYSRNSFERLVMLTIGSGIAPVYSITNGILNDENDETRIHLIGAFQTVSQVPLRQQLQRFCDYWNFKCTLHISRPRTDSEEAVATSIHGITIKNGRLTERSVADLLSSEHPPDRTFVVICGTRQFVRMVEQTVEPMGYRHLHAFKSD